MTQERSPDLEPFWKNLSRAEEGLACMRGFLIRNGDFRFLNDPPHEIYPFASPLFLTPARQEEISRTVRAVAASMESVGRWFRDHPDSAREHLLFPTALDEEFFRTDPCFPDTVPVFRMDMFLPEQGPPLLMEINTGCPGGELDPALVAEAFSNSPFPLAMAANANKKYGFPFPFQDPRDESLHILLKCYDDHRARQPGLPERPTIGLITSSAQARFMLPECRGIAGHYRSRGYRTLVGDLFDLVPAGDELLLSGEPIHLVFRKFSTQSFRLRMEDTARFGPENCHRVRKVWSQLARNGICMVNPLGTTTLQDKGLLHRLPLNDPTLRHVVLDTHVLHREVAAEEPQLWDAIRGGEEFILKRRLSYGGKHVILDPGEVRERAPRLILDEPGGWVAQKRASPWRYPFAAWDGRGVKTGRFPFIISPFGDSCFVRVGLGNGHGPLNAHQGSATTCAMVLAELLW